MTHRTLFFVFAMFLLISAISSSDAYVHNLSEIGDEYIKTWSVVGPFSPSTLKQDFLEYDARGERGASSVHIGENAFVNFQGEKLAFKQHNIAGGNVVDFVDAIGNDTDATVYAYCVLNSATRKKVSISLGIDGAIALWLNGVRLYQNARMESMTLDSILVKKVLLKKGENYVLVKVAREVADQTQQMNSNPGINSFSSLETNPWGFAMRILPEGQAITVSGMVTNGNGIPLARANVHLEKNSDVVVSTQTNSQGYYKLVLYPAIGVYDLAATIDTLGVWKLGIKASKGTNSNLDLQLREAISAQGTLLMLDKKTPHTSIIVEAIQKQKVVAKALSDTEGKYQLINLKPGQYQIRAQVTGKKVLYNAGQKISIKGNTRMNNIDLQFAPTKKGFWKKYTYLEGLVNGHVNDIYVSLDGSIWLATDNGISHYDGKNFENFTQADGLAGKAVRAICGAEKNEGVQSFSGGYLWFATDNGVSLYDGKTFKNFKAEDSNLLSNNVFSAYRHTRTGDIWFGTDNGAIQYNTRSNRFQIYIQKEHRKQNVATLPDDQINGISEDQTGALWFATNGGVARLQNKRIDRVLTTSDGLPNHRVHTIYTAPDGNLWFGTEGGVAYYNGTEVSMTLTQKDGLISNNVRSIYRDTEGIMWFGTHSETSDISDISGVSRYDGQGFSTFTTQDGLSESHVNAINGTTDGLIWFGTLGGGISSYNEKGAVNFTTKDGLGNDRISCIREHNGIMWIGTDGGGLARYDGKSFSIISRNELRLSGWNWVFALNEDSAGNLLVGGPGSGLQFYQAGAAGKKGKVINLFRGDKLGTPHVLSIHPASDGSIWVGVFGGGATRYQNGKFSRLTTNEGLLGDQVWSIAETDDGSIWLGTQNGVVKYNNGTISGKITKQEGLAFNYTQSIHLGLNGDLWFANSNWWKDQLEGGGAVRYNEKTTPKLKNYTVRTTGGGLASNLVRVVYVTPDGRIWFGTNGAGISVYDPSEDMWAQINTKDGLAGNVIDAIYQDSKGTMWFGTATGLTQYNRTDSDSKVRIVSVQTGENDSTRTTKLPSIAAGERVTIQYRAIDFKVPFEKRLYRCRVTGEKLEGNWQPITKETSFDFTFPKAGQYQFEVQFVDPELKHSEASSLALDVAPPSFHRSNAFLAFIGLIIAVALGGGGIQTRRVLLQRREIAEYRSIAVQELEDAHEIQMDLMPLSAPEIPKFEIAGKCVPASEVGGDFFDYITHKNDQSVGIAVADVSGKMMQGAMNAVMTNGVLHLAAREEDALSPTDIVDKVNSILAIRMKQDTNVTMIFGFLDPEDLTFDFVNAGHHAYPILVRNGTVEKLEHFGFPLGMKHPVEYQSRKVQLQTGDLVLLMTDGIIEPLDEHGAMYSETDKLETLLSNLPNHVSISGIIEQIINDAMKHAQNVEQQLDDITVVAIRVIA